MYDRRSKVVLGRSGASVVVVGGGPVGCRAAAGLARGGLGVTLVEEHRSIGLPCHCTGIVTRDLLDIIRVPERLVVNNIQRVRVTAPDGSSAELPSSDVVLDRIGFERHLAEEAARAGVRILTGHRFIGFTPGGVLLRSATGERVLDAALVVGADGPMSTVARRAGLGGPRLHYAGLQARVEGSFTADLYGVHLVVPGFFGWVVPESATVARVGVAARTSPGRELASLLARIGPFARILDRQRGLIPLYEPTLGLTARVEGVEVLLVGDAAGMVKATTGGGLVPGLIAADALGACVLGGTSYRRALAPVRRRLAVHLRIRRALDTFTDGDYDRLVALCAGRRVAATLARGSRDRPLRLLAGLMLADPTFGLFGLGALLRRPEPGGMRVSSRSERFPAVARPDIRSGAPCAAIARGQHGSADWV